MALDDLEYVALKIVRANGKQYEPGEIVPGAGSWRTLPALLSQGTLAPVLPREEIVQASSQDPEPQEEDEEPEETEEAVEEDDPLEEYHTGSGWYKVPGHDNKLRRDDAEQLLSEES